MAAPMTPAEPVRSQQIKAKEDAIKRRLDSINSANKNKAQKQVAADIAALKKKHKTGVVSESYQTQKILGADKGFAQSDYGVGKGAAIPYQIGTSNAKLMGAVGLPIYKPKPPRPSSPPGDIKYPPRPGNPGKTVPGRGKYNPNTFSFPKIGG